MSPFSKYMLLQIPGWVVAGFVLYGLVDWRWIPAWLGAAIFTIFVAKDFALYPFVRHAFRSDAKTGTEELVGRRGIACEPLDPQGYVQVQGERWQAEAEPGRGPIAAGSRIRVKSARGFKVIVEPDTGWRVPSAPGGESPS